MRVVNSQCTGEEKSVGGWSGGAELGPIDRKLSIGNKKRAHVLVRIDSRIGAKDRPTRVEDP